MKMNKTNKKTAVLILLITSVLLFLSACSGVLAGDDVVRISVSQLADESSGRFISGTASNGYVVVLDKDRIYSLNNFSGDAYNYLVNGEVYIANLPPGDYIFGVALLDENDKNLGFAVKEWTVEKGFNDISIEVAPGIVTLSVSDLNDDITNPFLPPEGVFVEFAENTIIFDYDRTSNTLVGFAVTFGDGTEISGPSVDPINGEEPVLLGGLYEVPEGTDGISFSYSATVDSVTQDYEYRIILK